MNDDEGQSLAEARSWLREHAAKGERCPCCTQFVKIYERKIGAGMANALIIMYNHAGQEWFRMPNISHRWKNRDESNLKYWKLIVESTEKREDGGRAGWWQVTDLGVRFIYDDLRLPKYARTYDNRLLKYHGEELGILDALSTKFNYRDLMDGV